MPFFARRHAALSLSAATIAVLVASPVSSQQAARAWGVASGARCSTRAPRAMAPRRRPSRKSTARAAGIEVTERKGAAELVAFGEDGSIANETGFIEEFKFSTSDELSAFEKGYRSVLGFFRRSV